MTLRETLRQPGLHIVTAWLRDYRSRTDTTSFAVQFERLSRLKREAVTRDDQLTAKAVWCLERVAYIQKHFISAFQHIRADEFEEAWHELDSGGNQIRLLNGHFTEKSHEFGIEHVRRHTEQLQELYPFKWGISPAIIYREVLCSICDTKLTLRTKCAHTVGEIYDGEMCARSVTDAELLHISLVENPVQKFSVIFPNGNDDPRLALVRFVGTGLNSPWDGWSYSKEERRLYHPAFRNADPSNRCPCGTTLPYRQCCLDKEQVLPHYQVLFDKEPPVELQELLISIGQEGNSGNYIIRS